MSGQRRRETRRLLLKPGMDGLRDPEQAAPRDPEQTAPRDPEPAAPRDPEPAAPRDPELAAPREQEPNDSRAQVPTTSQDQESASSQDQKPTAPKDWEQTDLQDQDPTAPRDLEPIAPRDLELGAPRDQEPSAPRDQEPTDPRDQEPTAPRDQEPTAPRDQEPTAPRDQEPTVQRDQEPTAPRDQEPTAPRDQEPTAPRNQEPTVPRDQEPTVPRDQEPTVLRDQEPTVLRDQEPTVPRDQEPTAPRDQEPTAPRDQEPTAPQDQEPTAPRDQEPTAPRDQEPTAPRDQEPTAPRDQEPTAPRDQEPTAPRDQEPTAPRDQEPTAPRDQEPTAPRDQELAAPRDQELAVPQGQEPAAPRDQEPAVPQGQEPAAPRDQELAAPRDQELAAPRDQELAAPQGQELAATRYREPAALQEPGSAAPQEPESAAPREPEWSAPQEPEWSAPQEPESAAPQEPESAAPQEPESAAPQEPESAAPQEPESAAPQEPESSAPREPESSAPREPESSVPQEPESAAPQEPESAAPQEPESAAPQEPESAAPQEPESAAPQEPESAAPQEPESAAPQEPESAAPQEPESAAPQEPESAAPQEPESAAPQEPESAAPQEPESAAPQEPESAAPQEPESAASQEPESAASQEPESAASQEPESAASQEPALAAPLEPDPAALQNPGTELEPAAQREPYPAAPGDPGSQPESDVLPEPEIANLEQTTSPQHRSSEDESAHPGTQTTGVSDLIQLPVTRQDQRLDIQQAKTHDGDTSSKVPTVEGTEDTFDGTVTVETHDSSITTTRDMTVAVGLQSAADMSFSDGQPRGSAPEINSSISQNSKVTAERSGAVTPLQDAAPAYHEDASFAYSGDAASAFAEETASAYPDVAPAYPEDAASAVQENTATAHPEAASAYHAETTHAYPVEAASAYCKETAFACPDGAVSVNPEDISANSEEAAFAYPDEAAPDHPAEAVSACSEDTASAYSEESSFAYSGEAVSAYPEETASVHAGKAVSAHLEDAASAYRKDASSAHHGDATSSYRNDAAHQYHEDTTSAHYQDTESAQHNDDAVTYPEDNASVHLEDAEAAPPDAVKFPQFDSARDNISPAMEEILHQLMSMPVPTGFRCGVVTSRPVTQQAEVILHRQRATPEHGVLAQARYSVTTSEPGPISDDAQPADIPTNDDGHFEEISVNNDAPFEEITVNDDAQPEEASIDDDARPEEASIDDDTRPNEAPKGGTRPRETTVNNGARTSETSVNGGARPKEAPVNGSPRPVEKSTESEMLQPLTSTTAETSPVEACGSHCEAPSREATGGADWRGHRNEMLYPYHDTSVLHIVFPTPCSNNCTVKYNHIGQGQEAAEQQKNFAEDDNGKPKFICQEGPMCSRNCPVLGDEVAFPVVALDFDSFYKAYHVSADACQTCRPGVGLARAATTGRVRLIYEQMNGAHPQQVAFRVWEHERGAKVEARCKPPATNTLVTIESIDDRDLKPQEYEHLFTVLAGLRGVQSLFTYISALWDRTMFAHQKCSEEVKSLRILRHVKKVTTDLKEAGILQVGIDEKLRGTAAVRCRPGKNPAEVEREPWCPRVEKNGVEMQWLQCHGPDKVRKELSTSDAGRALSWTLWGTMISLNEPESEKHYLDMPFSPRNIPSEEHLLEYKKQLEPDVFRQKFLTQLKRASEEKNATDLGFHYSWNGVLYIWKLRRWIEDIVRDRIVVQKLSTIVESVDPPHDGDKDDSEAPVLQNRAVSHSDAAQGGIEACGATSSTIGSNAFEAGNISANASESGAVGADTPEARTASTTSETGAVSADTSEAKTDSTDAESNEEPLVKSPSCRDALPEWRSLGSTSPQPTLQLPAESSENLPASLSRAPMIRDKSRDSGYPYSSGSGTESRDGSATRSGSLGSGSAPPGSASPPSSNSGTASPADHEPASGPELTPHVASGRDDYDTESVSEPSATASREHEVLSAAALKEWAKKAPLTQRSQGGGDVSSPEEDNTSDTSTIKGSASTLTKSSRRRSSGEVSGGSDFDDTGSVFSKSFSPSKVPGRNRRDSREEGLTGETVQTFVIPEEHNVPEVEKLNDSDKNIDDSQVQLGQRGTLLEPGQRSSQTKTMTANTSTGSNQAKLWSDIDYSEENGNDEITTYEELSGIAHLVDKIECLKNPHVCIHAEQNKELLQSIQAEVQKVTKAEAPEKRPFPTFMCIDDRQRMVNGVARNLARKDFAKQLRDAHKYGSTLNMSSAPALWSEQNLREKPGAGVANAGQMVQSSGAIAPIRPDEAATAASCQQTAQSLGDIVLAGPDGPEATTPCKQVAQSSGARLHPGPDGAVSLKADGSGSPVALTANSRGMEGRNPHVSAKTGAGGVSLKRRSPLKVFSPTKSSTVPPSSENGDSAPPIADINETPFGLSSISRRQVKKDPKQARYICRSMIMQRGIPLNCLCAAVVGDDQLKRLAKKLEDMVTKGRFLPFVKGQRKLLDHVCKSSVMEYVHKACSRTKTDLTVLNDVMIILGLHHDLTAKPYSYCLPASRNGRHGASVPERGKEDSTGDGQLAEMSSREASLHLSRHHASSIGRYDFFDVSRNDPLTYMTLHEHLLREPVKAAGLTPFKLLLERHINPELLAHLCVECNEYAKRRENDRLFCRWNEVVPDEMRLFLLQMTYMASQHSSDQRWDTPSKPDSKDGHKAHSPSRCPIVEVPARIAARFRDPVGKQHEAPPDDDGDPANPSGRPNTARLRASMSAERFRQIAASWRALDFWEPPHRRERLEALQASLDALMDARAVPVRPALLAVGARGLRCRVLPVSRRGGRLRRADVSLVMDGKRYIHDLVVTTESRRQRFHKIHADVVSRIRDEKKPHAPECATKFAEDAGNSNENGKRRAEREAGKANGTKQTTGNDAGGLNKKARDAMNNGEQTVKDAEKTGNASEAIEAGGKPVVQRAPVDRMRHFYYMDGLDVAEAERCADAGMLCLAPISPEDPRWSEFATGDEDMPRLISKDGGLTCVPYGRREKVNFFWSRDSTPRFRLVCSAIHRLDGLWGRSAVQQVEATQPAVREAVRQATTRLSHGRSTGLRYYHRLFLRALSACMQNTIIAHGIALKVAQDSPDVRDTFDSSAASLAAYCEAEFENLLSELMDWLAEAPRVQQKRKKPEMSFEVEYGMTYWWMNYSSTYPFQFGGQQVEYLDLITQSGAATLVQMAEGSHQVGDAQPGVSIVSSLGDAADIELY